MTTPVLPPPSYPGTLKQFTTKQDGQVIYGEHANEWQEEIYAMQQTVGVNPQIDYKGNNRSTVNGRLAYLEGDVVRLEGNQLIYGTKEFHDTLQADGYLIANNAPVTFKYADRQYYFDDLGVQGLNGSGTYRDLVLQPTGGQVFRAGFRMWDAGNDGPGSGLDADTLDGYHATDFLIRQGCQVGMTADQNIPPCPVNGNVFNARTPVNFNTVTWEHTPGDGTAMFKTDSPYGNYILITTSGLWVVDVNIPWAGPWNGARMFMVRNGNYPANSLDPAATTYMGHSLQVGIGPPVWPDPTTYAPGGTFSSTTIFPTLTDKSRVLYLPAGTKLRTDAFNWNDTAQQALISAVGGVGVAAHLHSKASFTVVQVA